MAENEIKYVLRGYAELEEALTPLGWCDIAQGYLTPNVRVRRITYPTEWQGYYFGYKQRLLNGHNLEIEPPISQAVFDEAWDYTTERVAKRRISIDDGPVKWDIDFYRWSHPYFVLAEVEMPGDMLRPEEVFLPLQPYLVYEVPRDDGRFAARRLSDEDHVRAMAIELGLVD